MGKIFNVLKAHQISLGEFEGEIDKGQGVVIKTAPKLTSGVTEAIDNGDKWLGDLLEINPLMFENLKEIEKPIYAIGIYILESIGRIITDSTSVHRRMISSRFNTRGSEYTVLNKIEDGQTSDDELAFRYISIIHQMIYREDKNIEIRYTSSELVAVIRDPKDKGIPILIRFKYRKDGNQTLEKANKLQVNKISGIR